MKKFILVVFALSIGVMAFCKEVVVGKPKYYKIGQSEPFFKGKGNIQFVTVIGIVVYELVMDGTTPGESKGATRSVQKPFSIDVPVSDLKNLKYYLSKYLNPKPTPTPEIVDINP